MSIDFDDLIPEFAARKARKILLQGMRTYFD